MSDTPTIYDDEDDPHLDETLAPIAGRAANEGLPVLCIARLLAKPSEQVYGSLHRLLGAGVICEIPRPDWPPTAKNADRLPQEVKSPADLQFACIKFFKLTPLEGAFISLLLRVDHADKMMLHRAVEAQRFSRAQQPDSMEATDPKMVDVMICKLRKKLKDARPEFDNAITTLWGAGYYIDAVSKAAIMAAIFEKDTPKESGNVVKSEGQESPAPSNDK